MITNLQTLRGVAAIMIFAHHFGFTSSVTDSFGDCAVAVFMMLSGFVLTLAFSSPGKPAPNLSRFMTKRLTRIYPLYLIGQLATFALLKFDIGPAKAVADILMLQSWIPTPDYYFSGNSPSWFVSDLMLCYLVFLPLDKLLTSGGKTAFLFIAAILTSYFLCVRFIPDNLVHPIIYIFPPMQLPVFIIGMLAAKIFNKIPRPTLRAVRADIPILAAVSLFAILIYYYPDVSTRLSLSSYWWPATFILILLLSLYDKTKCVTTTVLHTPVLVRLGDISYAFYILHLPFLYVWQRLFRHFGYELPTGIDFIVSVSLLAVICVAVHRLVEVPATKYLDRLSSRLQH